MTTLEKLDIYKNEYLPYFIETRVYQMTYASDLQQSFNKTGALPIQRYCDLESFNEFLSRRVAVDPIIGKKVFKDGNWYLIQN